MSRENRLTRVEYDGDGSGLTAIAAYRYDSQGRRIEFIDSVREITTRYYYDGPNVIVETNQTDTARRSYVHGTQYIDERVLMRDHTQDPIVGDDRIGQDHYYLLKDLYTVAGLVSRNGAPEEYYVYDTYGQAVIYEWPPGDVDRDGTTEGYDGDDANWVDSRSGEPEPLADVDLDGDVDTDDEDEVDFWDEEPALELTYSSLDNPYFFTGRLTDTLHASSLYMEGEGSDPDFRRIQDNRNRTYDPKHGRWLQRDPERYADGMSLYLYVRNAPLVSFDPFGLYTVNQLVGRFGEQVLVNVLERSGQYVILLGPGHNVAAHGPDVIAFNKESQVFEFFDNKAWAREGKVYSAPKWMRHFDISKYQSILDDGIEHVAPEFRAGYRSALKAAGRGNVTLKITSCAGRVTGVGRELVEKGIQFVTNQELKALSRQGAARATGANAAGKIAGRGVCAIPVVGIALEVLMNPSTAYAEEIPPDDPDYLFNSRFWQILETIRRSTEETGRVYLPSHRRWVHNMHSVHEDFLQHGYLYHPWYSRGLLKGYPKWSDDLTEADLDYINERINMSGLFEEYETDLENHEARKLKLREYQER